MSLLAFRPSQAPALQAAGGARCQHVLNTCGQRSRCKRAAGHASDHMASCASGKCSHGGKHYEAVAKGESS